MILRKKPLPTNGSVANITTLTCRIAEETALFETCRTSAYGHSSASSIRFFDQLAIDEAQKQTAGENHNACIY